MIDYKKADRDLTKGHTLLQGRWPVLLNELQKAGFVMFVNEVFRPNVRQQWLFGAGRTEVQVLKKGIWRSFARPQERVVTNSWSSSNSAHGWVDPKTGQPAAAALDVVPLGADGKPWTKDDPWDAFIACVAAHEAIGLRHFHKPGKKPWDMPHLQLVEWSDAQHRLILPGA